MITVNETHDVNLKSWVASAQIENCVFPIQNLPYGVFVHTQKPLVPRIGVAIGDQILDLNACVEKGLFAGETPKLLSALLMQNLNGILSLGNLQWSKLRKLVSALLRVDSKLGSTADLRAAVLVPMTDVKMCMPAEVRNYTDFYASIQHATRVGKILRPENPLLPNYKYVPIAYHGRASSLVASGAKIVRPRGQVKLNDKEPPAYVSSTSLDYELELGAFVGVENALGVPVSIDKAADHLFGFCLLNDWSARDVQKWEYQPLGPFLGKNFATSISPWVVTTEALAPFRCAAYSRASADPAPLGYLHSEQDQALGGFDIKLQALLITAEMRKKKLAPFVLCNSNSKDLYWTPAQCIVHHTSNGCNLLPGDLLGSGTISGEGEESCGCLLEQTQGGVKSISLPSGESRKFLQDGDEVILTARAIRDGAVSIGFGEVRGEVVSGTTS